MAASSRQQGMKASKRNQRRTTARLSVFAQRLEKEFRRLSLAFPEKIVLGVSGGADSTALLLALDELIQAGRLNSSIIVGHLDHKLRSTSKKDADFVVQLAHTLGHEAVIAQANVRKRARDTADNLEQAARRARYEFFLRVAQEQAATMVMTAHTLDDQAETVLLRLLRGSAAEGLGGIEPVRLLAPNSTILLVRPLVSWGRRSETEHYCRTRHVDFRLDETNEDERFARVKVRKQLLPLMESFNNKVVEALGRSAALLREDATALAIAAEQLLSEATNGQDRAPNNAVPLNVKVLTGAPAAIRRRALRHWLLTHVGSLRRLEMVHFLAVERLLEKKGGTVVELPNGVRVRRQRDWLHLSVKTVEKPGSDL